MKANELMIWDLIRFKHISDSSIITEPHKITCISVFNGEIHADGEIYDLRFWNIEPIPLTPEILEKNGFEVTRNMSSSGNKDVWSLRVSKNKIFHIIEHHNKRQFPYFWIEVGSNSDIKYVHQLQHALRLCGIEKEIVL